MGPTPLMSKSPIGHRKPTPYQTREANSNVPVTKDNIYSTHRSPSPSLQWYLSLSKNL
jgi:hypothetical protein